MSKSAATKIAASSGASQEAAFHLRVERFADAAAEPAAKPSTLPLQSKEATANRQKAPTLCETQQAS